MKKRIAIVVGCMMLVALMATSVAFALTKAKENLGSPQTGVKGKVVTGKRGGTLSVIYVNTPSNLGQPWAAMNFADGNLGRYCVENLVGIDRHGNPIPQLATSWKVKRSAKTITFQLRKGVKFHDGTSFNAEAAKWCLDKFRTGGKADLKSISSVEVKGPYTIVLHYTQYNPLLIQQMSSGYSGRMVAQSSKLLEPVGTGPFQLVSYQPNVSLVYKRFKNYWQKGLPFLNGVKINLVADKTVGYTSFTKGEAQVIFDVSPTNAALLKKKGNKVDRNMVSLYCIAGDSKNPNSKWSDINFRRGVAHAIDNEKIVKAASKNFWTATDQLACKGWQAYNPKIKGYPYNVAKAKSYLAKAGVSTSNPITIPLNYMQTEEGTAYCTAVAGYLQKVGIILQLKPLPTPSFYAFARKEWTNQLLMVAFSYNGVEMQYATSAANNLSNQATTNVSVKVAPAYQAALTDALYQQNAKKREALYRKMNKIAIDTDCTLVPQYGYRVLSAKSPKVKNYNSMYISNVEFLPEIAYLK